MSLSDSRSFALDPRLTPARPDLAASFLKGKVEAAQFVEGRAARIAVDAAPMRRAPSQEASLETEALHGEDAVVFDEARGWCWGQLLRDGYVGYLPAEALGPPAPTPPTHRLAVPHGFAYAGPSIKTPPLAALSLGARFAILERVGDFAIAGNGWHIFARHLTPIDSREEDFVGVAERFLNTPYLWGGRTWRGVDCSGLAQTALAEAGIAAPRDSDMQEAMLGTPVPVEESLSGLRRGDLVFWRGHVGMMRDGANLLHANGWHMRVVSEPLALARDRTMAAGGGPITSIRRL